jgi:hypothetical protein
LRFFAQLVGSLALLSACADDAARCPQAELCDITSVACQEAIMQTVSCMRGGSTALPRVSVVSEAALQARLIGEDMRTEQERKASAQWLEALSLFKLAPPSYDSERADADAIAQYAAVYLGDSKEILVVDRGEPLASEQAVALFAHELTHALQDAEHGLRSWRERWVTSYDSALATDTVVEGEAVLYELLVSLQLSGIEVTAVDWEGYFTDWRKAQLDLSELDATPLTMADVRFPYAFGGGYVMQRYLAGGRAEVRALWEQPPLSTREVLFGASRLDAARVAELSMSSMPSAGPGFSLLASTPLGAWIVRQFVARTGIPVAERLHAAETLAYDMFTVQTDAASGELLAGWRFDFSEPHAMPDFGGTVTTWRDGERAWFMAASDRARDLRTLAWGPVQDGAQPSETQVASVPWLLPRRHEGCTARPPRPDARR